MTETVTTWTALSKAVNRNRNQLRHWQQTRESFPAGPPWDCDEVRLWLDDNVRSKKKIRGIVMARKRRADKIAQMPAEECRSEQESPAANNASDFDSGDPLLIARAAVRVAGRQYAASAKSGVVERGSVEALKKALEELRHCERSWIDLAVKRGELIERTVAAEVAGHLAQRAVQVLADVGSRVTQQVEVWCADKRFRKLGTEARAMQVREWFDGLARSARSTEADAMDALIREMGEES